MSCAPTGCARVAPCARSPGAARVSLGYLSEVERGQKEASSELLASICSALDLPLSQVLSSVSDEFALVELADSASTTPVASAA